MNRINTQREKDRILTLRGAKSKSCLERIEKKNTEVRLLKEMKECSFRPKLNNSFSSKRILVNRESVDVFERNQSWIKKKIDSMEFNKKLSKVDEIEECKFKPKITKNIPVFAQTNFDNRTIQYFERINKSRGKKLNKNTIPKDKSEGQAYLKLAYTKSSFFNIKSIKSTDKKR